MENYGIYEDMASRTSGAVYIGVVGPVRTGKSTFIKRFMETLVLEGVSEEKRAEAADELPQVAQGKTVMTTEPKFVPSTPAELTVQKGTKASVRLVDCVGFPVVGASGFEEDGAPRLIGTPWSEEPMPFERAAEIGTERVIREHSTVGVLVTTDGSFTSIARENYEAAEERAAGELKALGKPFVIVLNCVDEEQAAPLRERLQAKYGVTVVALNVEKAEKEDFLGVLQKTLLEFPLLQIDIRFPAWLQSLPLSSRPVKKVVEKVKDLVHGIVKMKDCALLEQAFLGEEEEFFAAETELDLGKGKATLSLAAREGAFYKVLGEECGVEIADDLAMLRLMKTLCEEQGEYAKIKDAFKQAKDCGYGVALPTVEELVLEKPSLIKRGANYGVRFGAKGASYHILKVDVRGESAPIVGGKEQGESFLQGVLSSYGEEQKKVLDTNIFGRSLKDLLETEILRKAEGVPVPLRAKFTRTLGKIVNDGKGGFFCILL